jgi:hypothetical protein
MASITTRETGTTGVGGVTRKDLPLTNAEIDTNFINLNTDKLELSDAVSTNTVNTVVRRDSSGNFSAGTITANLNATTATIGTLTLTNDLSVANGGTGLSSSGGSGFLLIGNSSNTFTAATLTGTSNRVTVTNGSGSITLSTPQDIATSSNVQFGSIGVGTAASGTPGTIRATNDIVAWYSDERLKDNIQVIPNALEKILTLRGVTFRPNSIAESFGYKKENHVGVIAQDVERVLPEAVKPAPFDIMLFENTEISRSGQDYKTVQYEKLVPLLIEAIKELNKEVMKLKGIK